MDNDVLLSVKGVSVEYKAARGNVHAVNNVSFDIRKGEFFGLAGESGCGKTTMAFTIMRLLKGAATVTSGSIEFEGQNILAFSKEEMRTFRWAKASIVAQSAMNNLNPVVTIRSQLMDAITAHEEVSPKEANARAEKLLGLVNISTDRLDAFPHELSGGQRQRVAIAMALALNPKLVIFDEPTTALDVVVQYNIIKKIVQLKDMMGFSILFITHDLPLMLQMCDRIGVMYAGKMVEVAPVDILLEQPAHPYTNGLLKAFPSLVGPLRKLEGIPGSIPDLITPPKGCFFYDRCHRKQDICKETPPAFEALSSGHNVACYNKMEQ
ncbi:MAG: ABC transporter ATP-binding protein [Anaerolineales bacterium]|nr:ABC transporter ATP-binding protein [Anaerolineales bacterium]